MVPIGSMVDGSKSPNAPTAPALEKTVSPDSPFSAGPTLRAPEGFVRGGTTSFGHDMELQKNIAEADARRLEADKERGLVKDGARVYTNKLSENGSIPQAYVLLDYLTAKGEPLYDHGVPVQCLADLQMLNPLDPGELTLTIVCPSCIARGPKGSQQFSQLRIRQKNRSWHLDTRTAGELIVFEGHPYRSAGMIMDSEVIRCGECGWAARIDKNKVRPV
jgi:hypothetical protein